MLARTRQNLKDFVLKKKRKNFKEQNLNAPAGVLKSGKDLSNEGIKNPYRLFEHN